MGTGEFDISTAGSFNVNPLAEGATEDAPARTSSSLDLTLFNASGKYGFGKPDPEDSHKATGIYVSGGLSLTGAATPKGELQFQRDKDLAALQAEIDSMDPEDTAGIAAKQEEYDNLAASPLPDGFVSSPSGYVAAGYGFIGGDLPIDLFRVTFDPSTSASALYGAGIARLFGDTKGQFRFELNRQNLRFVTEFKGPLTPASKDDPWLYFKGGATLTYRGSPLEGPNGEDSAFEPGFDGLMRGMFLDDGVPLDLGTSATFFFKVKTMTLGIGGGATGTSLRDPNNSSVGGNFAISLYNSDRLGEIAEGVYYPRKSGRYFDFRKANIGVSWQDTSSTALVGDEITLGETWTYDYTHQDSLAVTGGVVFGVPTIYPLPSVFRPGGGPSAAGFSANPLSLAVNVGLASTSSRGHGLYGDGTELQPWEDPTKVNVTASVDLIWDFGLGTDWNARYPKDVRQ